MESPTGEEDIAELPPRPDSFTPELWALAVKLLSPIAGTAAVPIWLQGASVFPSGQRGRILVYVDDDEQGYPRFVQAIADEVARRLSPAQDNTVPGSEMVRLSELQDSPEVAAIKRENRLLGLRWASAVRRWQRAGLDRRAAVASVATLYHRSTFVVTTLVKHASEARRRRIERIRETLIPLWEISGLEIPQIANRLNVTCHYARRLCSDIRWRRELQRQENPA
jgi:hypothetical protein